MYAVILSAEGAWTGKIKYVGQWLPANDGEMELEIKKVWKLFTVGNGMPKD